MKEMKEMFKRISEVQEQMQEMDSELAKLHVEGETGAGLVKVSMTGQRKVFSVSIDESVMDDREMLEDLIAGAINDALRKVDKLYHKQVDNMAGKFGLPPVPPGWLG